MSFENFGRMFPGMERFLEETEINVEVNNGDVPAEDAVVEATETADATEEIIEGDAEAEETEANTEQMFRNFDELARMLRVAKTNGVDRTFLSLCNSRGELSSFLGLSLPACESYDAIGTPGSSVSQAVIVGLEGALSKVWTFIRNIAQKVISFIGRIATAIINVFSAYETQIRRLIEAEKKLNNKVPSKAVKHVSIADIAAAAKIANEVATFAISANADKVDDNFIKQISDNKEKLDNIKLESKEGNMSAGDFRTAIAAAQALLQKSRDVRSCFDKLLRDAKDSLAEAKRNENMGTTFSPDGTDTAHTSEATQKAKDRVTAINKQSSLVAKTAKTYTRLLKACLATAAAYIRACKGGDESLKETKATNETSDKKKGNLALPMTRTN